MDLVDFVTDTSTLCVFDVAALRHRIEDECDWWTVPNEELSEMNDGNVAFIGLGEDGKYQLEMKSSLERNEACTVLLSCPSGHVFIGAGEEVTGGGLEPEAIRGGMFTTVIPGRYRLAIRRNSIREIVFSLNQHEGETKNHFTSPVRI